MYNSEEMLREAIDKLCQTLQADKSYIAAMAEGSKAIDIYICVEPGSVPEIRYEITKGAGSKPLMEIPEKTQERVLYSEIKPSMKSVKMVKTKEEK